MAIAKCGQCKGKGKTSGKPCLGCGGDGHVKVPDPATPCGQCLGSGKSSGKQCQGCKGCGWVLG